MSTRFPVSNLPTNMQEYGHAIETSLVIAENAQTNTSSVVGSMRQAIASNYGLGQTLTDGAGIISDKVYTDLQNLSNNPASAVTLQRSWTNLAGSITITTPTFISDISLAVASTAWLDVTGGDPGATYSHWIRVNITGAVTGTKWLPRIDFGQIMLAWEAVPASSTITVQPQVWGIINNPGGTFVNGSISTSTVVRLSTSLRAIALV